MSNPNPSTATRFKQAGSVPLAKKVIGVRLPIDLDAAVRELAGEELSDWVREAIAEKLARETQDCLQGRDCA